ncbi:MAG: hypothetical protein QGH33_20885, partial [Pirellulaceae bacterium]|nr:hypothetical protein [Pirellulaceae bacterium]
MNRSAAVLSATLLTGAWLSVAGCGVGGTRSNLPTIRELGSRPGANIPDSNNTGPTVYTGIHRLDLPYAAHLREAWALVDTAAVPESMSHWWQRN